MNQHRAWTKKERDYLENHYGVDTASDIADTLDRTKRSIYIKANRMNLSQEQEEWTKKEEQFLQDNWDNMSGSEIGKKIGRSAQKVLAKGKAMNLPRKGEREEYNKWTQDEEMFMWENYTKMNNKDIAQELGRTKSSVNRKADRMDLSNRWEQWEDEVLFFCYDYNADSAEELSNTTLSHRTKESIKLRAQRKLNLKYGRERVNKTCPTCGKEFSIKPSHAESRKYCSKNCFYAGSEPTDIEKKIMKELDKSGINYEFQKEIGDYWADFYLPNYNAIIEADGNFWHQDGIKEDRENFLWESGYNVIHFSGTEIHNNVEGCITETLIHFGGVSH